MEEELPIRGGYNRLYRGREQNDRNDDKKKGKAIPVTAREGS
jgi:hypothetical protein